MSYLRLSRFAFALVGATLTLPALANQGSFALKDGDRAVFYGDSITDYGAYFAIIDLFVATRYPEWTVSCENAGVGGDRVTGGGLGPIDLRMTRDLFARRPTVVTCMLGMNDASYRPFDQAIFDTYRKGYEHIADRLRKEAPDARVWLIAPSAYDDVTRPPTFEGGYNAVLARYGEFVSDLARSRRFGLIDLNKATVDMLVRAKAINADLAARLVPDRVHPTFAGHLGLASGVLKAWNAPSVVSSTTIDWGTGKATTENATLSNWRSGSFRLLEKALPMPIDRQDQNVVLAAASCDFDRSFNQQILKVDGMPGGRYALKIDGKPIGSFSASEYAAGVNLAVLDTPMLAQAKAVASLSNRLVSLRYTRWRPIQIGLAAAPSREREDVVRSMERLEKAMVRERQKAAKPVAHNFELVAE